MNSEPITRLMPRRRPVPVVVFHAWYTEAQWLAVKADSDEPADMDASYGQWLAQATRMHRRFQAEGMDVRKVLLDADEVHAWCDERGLPRNRESRSEFAAWKGQQPADHPPAVPAPVTKAVQAFRSLFEGLGHPITYRKMNPILNAMEMGIEDGGFSPSALRHLSAALVSTAELYGFDPVHWASPPPPRHWNSPSTAPRNSMAKSAMTAQLKSIIQGHADRLVAELKAECIAPPPEAPRFNYLIDLYTKWRGDSLYLLGTMACPFPEASVETFETQFSRLTVGGYRSFQLAYMRHTGKWETVFLPESVEDAFDLIREVPFLRPERQDSQNGANE